MALTSATWGLVARLGSRPWRSAPLAQVARAVAGGVLATLALASLHAARGLGDLAVRAERERRVTVFLSAGTSPEAALQAREAIRAALGAAAGGVRLYDRDETLRTLAQSAPELARELEEASPQDADRLLPRYLGADGPWESAAVDRVRRLPGVESVEAAPLGNAALPRAAGALAGMAWAGAAALALAAALVLALTLRAQARQVGFEQAWFRTWGGGAALAWGPLALTSLVTASLALGVLVGGWVLLEARLPAFLAAIAPGLGGGGF